MENIIKKNEVIELVNEFLLYTKKNKSFNTYKSYEFNLNFWLKYAEILLINEKINDFIENQATDLNISSFKVKVLWYFLKWVIRHYPEKTDVKYLQNLPKTNRLITLKVNKNLNSAEVNFIMKTITENTKSYTGLMTCFLIMFQFYSGLRVSELFENRIQNLVPIDKEIKHIIVGKGNKQREIYVVDRIIGSIFKGKYAFRVYKFSDMFIHIQELLETEKGKRFWKEANYRKILTKANVWCKKAKGESGFPNFTSHSFRYGFCYRLIDNNVPITAVQKFMGHSNVETTARYVNFSENDMEFFYYSSELPIEKSLDIKYYKNQADFFKYGIYKLIKRLKVYEDISFPSFISDIKNEINY